MLLIWLVGGYFVIVHPRIDPASQVDAIVVLGPPDVDGRSDRGLALMSEHFAKTLVISVQSEEQRRVKSACANANPAYTVICFQPFPKTTRGEAEEVGRLARTHGWKKIMVITSKYHVSRARMLFERCLDGTLLVNAAPGIPSKREWAYQFPYQTAGYVKVFLHRDC